MKNLKTIIILVLVVIIISLIYVIFSMKNNIIETQAIAKEKLEETTNDNAYITLEAHNSELKDKQQEINNIQNVAGQVTATADKILKDYTVYKDGKLITGTMVNNGAVTSTLNAGGSYTIPAGYHNGSGKVTANSLASQTSATATSADITSGKTAWVNGSKVTGTATSVSNKLNKTLIGTLSVKYHNPSPSFTYDMKTITNNWASLTNDNFTTVFTSVGDEKWCGDYCCDGVTVSNPASISYNASTGIVTCSLKTARMNNNNKSSNAVTITAQFYVLYLI